MINISGELIAMLVGLGGLGFFVARGKYYKAKSEKLETKMQSAEKQNQAWEKSQDIERKTNATIRQKKNEVDDLSTIGSIIRRHILSVRQANAKHKDKDTDSQ